MDFKTLRLYFTNAKALAKTPTEKALRQSAVIFLQFQVGNAQITVYTNGYVAYIEPIDNKIRKTVFFIHKIHWYDREEDDQETATDLIDEFNNMNAEDVLALFGYSRIQHNSNGNYHNYVKKSLDTDTTKDSGTKSDIVEDIALSLLRRKEYKENIVSLNKAMSKLTPKQMEIVYKYFFENKSFLEIGRELNISNTSVHDRYNGAIKKLKKLFDISGS